MGKRKTYTVVCQKWEESERGWGTRPDGYSLHLSESDRKCFVEAYWRRMPDSVPDEYSRPDGTPYLCDVDETVYEKVWKEPFRHGKRFGGIAPGSGGTDGWVPLGPGVHGKK